MKCPNCKKEAIKIIYNALPIKFCEHCNKVWGFWSWIPSIFSNESCFFIKNGK